MSPGSLSFAKLVMMSSAPAKSAGDARYASQDPFIQSTLSHTISTPICIRSAFFLRSTQLFCRRGGGGGGEGTYIPDIPMLVFVDELNLNMLMNKRKSLEAWIRINRRAKATNI